MIPHRRVQNARVRGVHRQVARAAERVLALQQLRPRLAAIRRAVNAAITRALPAITLHRDIHHVGVARVHAHGRDLPRGGEADVGPGAPLIGALVHAVAIRRRLASDRMLSHAHVDHVLVAGRHRDRAHRPRLEEAVGDIAPAVAGVVGAPQAAAGIAGHVRERLRRQSHRRHRSAAAERADVAPRQRRERGRVECREPGRGARGLGARNRRGHYGLEKDTAGERRQKGGETHGKTPGRGGRGTK